jgi:hypothetical protein
LLAILILSLVFSTEVQANQEIPDATIHTYCEPQNVLIGEPFTLTVDIVHARAQNALLDRPLGEEDLALSDSWVLLEKRSVISLPLRDQPGMQLTQARWRVIGLEPGSFELQGIGADCVASGAVQRLDPGLAKVVVTSELAEGEDEARALVGFRPAPPATETPLQTVQLGLAGLVALVVISLAVVFLRRRKEAPALAFASTPMHRLGMIDPSDETQSRQAFFVLSGAVRESLDEILGETLSGLTDEEWIEYHLEESGHERQRVEQAAVLLRSCERVKYGAEAPTRFAVEEAVSEARSLCSDIPLVSNAGDSK